MQKKLLMIFGTTLVFIHLLKCGSLSWNSSYKNSETWQEKVITFSWATSMQQRGWSLFHSEHWAQEGDHSPAASVVLKNGWSYASTLPCAFVAWQGQLSFYFVWKVVKNTKPFSYAITSIMWQSNTIQTFLNHRQYAEVRFLERK